MKYKIGFGWAFCQDSYQGGESRVEYHTIAVVGIEKLSWLALIA